MPARLGTGGLLRFAWAALTSRSPEAYGWRLGRMTVAEAAGAGPGQSAAHVAEVGEACSGRPGPRTMEP